MHYLAKLDYTKGKYNIYNTDLKNGYSCWKKQLMWGR